MKKEEDFKERATTICHDHKYGLVPEYDYIEHITKQLYLAYMKGYNCGLSTTNKDLKRVLDETELNK